MGEFDFSEIGIARQHKLLDSRKDYDPRVAKFLAALDEIEKLRDAIRLALDEFPPNPKLPLSVRVIEILTDALKEEA